MIVSSLTQKELKEFLKYDKNTGVFTRVKTTTNAVKVGSVAGSTSKNGYLKISVKSKLYYAHRLAWLYEYGEMPNKIDHIDGNTLNNKINNLRNVTQSLNCRNAKMKSNNKSGYNGVSFHKASGKWNAKIYHNKKYHSLGYFNTKEEAWEVRKRAEKGFEYTDRHGRVA